jgi:hypothetical protein
MDDFFQELLVYYAGMRRRALIVITALFVLLALVIAYFSSGVVSEQDAIGANAHEFESDNAWDTFDTVTDMGTGVTYVVWTNGHSSGMAPLLDRNGRPVISEVGGE